MAGSEYTAASSRYDTTDYRFTGRSGLQLPPLSLGLWQNFGDDRPEETQRAILRRVRAEELTTDSSTGLVSRAEPLTTPLRPVTLHAGTGTRQARAPPTPAYSSA